MDGRINETVDSPPPETLRHYSLQRLASGNHTETLPFYTNLHNSDQPLESAFSRLDLSRESRTGSRTASFCGFTPAFDVVASAQSVPWEIVASAENQQSFFRAQPQSNNGGLNGPLGFLGPYQGGYESYEGVGFAGGGPHLNAVGVDHHPLRMVKASQWQDFLEANFDYYGRSFLHGNKPGTRNATNYLPVSSSAANRSNFSGPRSPSYGRHFALDSMRGKIVTLAKDQLWSGALSSRLEEGVSEDEIEIVLPEIMEFIGDLMGNQFGSRFVQMIFVRCNEHQRTRIIMALTGFRFRFLSICSNTHGVRAVQKLLEMLVTPQQISLVVSALIPDVIALATDINGQHVIHYCVKNFPGEYNMHLFDKISTNCFKIATSQSGCCVLQSCVENSHGKARERLISEIMANAVHLAEDPYGNYVVQRLMDLKLPDVTAGLLRRFKGHFTSLSCNKFASNVVEKFLKDSTESHSAAIIMELLMRQDASSLLLDPYGNFVIQTALSVSRGVMRTALFKLIEVHAPSMQSNLYGKKILASVDKMKLSSIR